MVDVDKLKAAIAARREGTTPDITIQLDENSFAAEGKSIAIKAAGDVGEVSAMPMGEKMLAEGTENNATVQEYVEALALKLLKHATIRQNMKVKPPGQPPRQMMVDVLIPEALNHVLTVIFSGGEVNDDTLAWKPSAVITKKKKFILPGE